MIAAEDLNYAKGLKVLRQAAGWKQLLAAEKIGISSQQEYSKLESGKIPFTESMLNRICNAFQVSREHFKVPEKSNYNVDWRDYISEGKITDLVELISNKGLITLLLSTEKRVMELELKLIEQRLKELQPKAYKDDLQDDKDCNI